MIDAADGAPLRDATVVALDAAGARRAAGASDSLGRFELRLPARAPYTIVVRHPWHAPRTITGVDASPSGPALDVRLEAHAITLSPVISASVRTESAHEAPAGVSIVTRSDIGDRTMLTPADVLRTATGVDLASKGLIQSTYTVRGDLSLNQASLLSDVSHTARLTPQVDVTGTYSWVSRNIVPDVVTVGTVVLNVPRDKGLLTVRYRSDSAGLSVALAGRVVGGFPLESGIFKDTIAPYAALDVRLSYRLPWAPGVSLSLDGYNVLDHRHREIAGAPEIGRLVAARVAVRF